MAELIVRRDTKIYRPDRTEEIAERELLSEHSLLVRVNNVPVFSLVCTREHLKELIVGRLFTEGILTDRSGLAHLYFCKYENEADVLLNQEIHWEAENDRILSCCTKNRSLVRTDGGRALQNVPELSVTAEDIFTLAEAFSKGTGLHSRTQMTHSAFLFRHGEICFCCEDVGRHNALDKAVGYALLSQIPLSECMLYTSGRVPVDMAEKAIAAGLPVLVSKAAPTSDAVELANKYGLMLIGWAHPERFECFTLASPVWAQS